MVSFKQGDHFLLNVEELWKGVHPGEDRINTIEQWKNLGWLGYIGDYTTQLYMDYNKPL